MACWAFYGLLILLWAFVILITFRIKNKKKKIHQKINKKSILNYKL